MIKVDDKTVEARGKLLEIINDLINVMKVIREGVPPENDEKRIDELLTVAMELSKKNSGEITPEYEKTVCEIVRERLSNWEHAELEELK